MKNKIIKWLGGYTSAELYNEKMTAYDEGYKAAQQYAKWPDAFFPKTKSKKARK